MRRLLCIGLVLGLLACGRTDEEPDTRTRAQRDSALAKSSVPGARAVERSLETSDAASQRAAAMDSIR